MSRHKVSAEEARRVGDSLRVNWAVVPLSEFQRGVEVELEHADVTAGDLMTTGRIVVDHLREFPDYYARLLPMEAEAEKYWASRVKPSPTLGGGQREIVLAVLVILAIVVIAVAIIVVRRYLRREKLSFPPVQDSLGYRIPVPGDPSRNILRRSAPYPPHRYPVGGLEDFYFRYDPAYTTGFENDYCHQNPVACGGFALEPFCSAV